MVGRGLANVIVRTPAPGMLKRMVSAPAAALASVMAWRKDPGPLFPVLVTVKVAARVCGAKAKVNNPNAAPHASRLFLAAPNRMGLEVISVHMNPKRGQPWS